MDGGSGQCALAPALALASRLHEAEAGRTTFGRVGLGNVNRNCTSPPPFLDHNTRTTEPGQPRTTVEPAAALARNGAILDGARQQQSLSMDDANVSRPSPAPTCKSRPSCDVLGPQSRPRPQPLPHPHPHSLAPMPTVGSMSMPTSRSTSTSPVAAVDQQQPQQHRLRQGSLAADWQFPSNAMGLPPSPPRPAQATCASGHAAVGASFKPPASSTRQGRHVALDFGFHQNSDPLVNHRLISSDPVSTTRTSQWPMIGSFAQPDHTAPPSHAGALSTISSPSETSPSRQLPPFVPSPSRAAYRSCYTKAFSLDGDRSHSSSRPDRNRGWPSSPAIAYSCTTEFEQQAIDSLPQTDTCWDRQFLPLTPVSPTGAGPRWDSLPPRDRFPYSEPASNGLKATFATDAPLSSDRGLPPSPARTPKSPFFATGLYAHPHIPEDKPLDLHYESETTRHEHAGLVTASGHSDRMYRPDSRMSGDTACSGETFNFSRPRKPSLKTVIPPDISNNMHMPLRPGTAKSTASDSLRFESTATAPSPFTNMPPHINYNPPWPRRQPSVGSNMSSATYTSGGLSPRRQASHDHLGAHQDVSQIPNWAGLPHNASPQAPPRHYNRAPPPYLLAQNQQSHLYEDELRSHNQSHLTTAAAQESLFTNPNDIVNTASVLGSSFRYTRQSSFFGPHNPVLDVRDSLSVDDVMGMYEHGFNDSEMDLTRRLSGMDLSERASMHLTPSRLNDHDESRPGTAMSHNSEAANRLLEAMRQPDPTPIPGRSFPLNGDSPVILPDTKAFFRKSLARSIPKDMRLSYASTKSGMSGVYAYGDEKEDLMSETDSARHSRHDSGKMVDPGSEENSPIADPEKHDSTLLATDQSIVPPGSDTLSPLPQPNPPQPIQGALQPEDLDPDANDRYGFRKQNQYVTRQTYDEWSGLYSEYLARRRKKWDGFLKENGLMTDQPNRFPQHSAKAKRFVRKGIPPEWRGAAWFYYAGGPKILANNQGLYDQMLKRVTGGELKEVCREDIERDLYRTFPDNVRFKRGPDPAAAGRPPSVPTPAHSRNNSTQSANPLPKAPGSEPVIIEQLRRVLSAFAIFNPSIGYCQSLNFLGGMLLLFVESEEQAFWLLNIITRVYLPGTHEMSLEGSKVDLSVLMAELQTTLPSVWTKISDDGDTPAAKKKPRRRLRGGAIPAPENLPPVTLALTAWFMSCFIGTLPIETTLRVWDVFFYEGSRTLFRVALAIFKAGESEIKSINDPMEVFAVVQTLPRKMLDANLLMETCFKRRSGLGHITAEEIDRSRTERREKLHVEQREKVAAAQAGSGLLSVASMDTRVPSDVMSVNSTDGPRRKHLFGRRAHTGLKERSGIEA